MGSNCISDVTARSGNLVAVRAKLARKRSCAPRSIPERRWVSATLRRRSSPRAAAMHGQRSRCGILESLPLVQDLKNQTCDFTPMDWSKNFNLILFILSKGSDSKSPPAASGCSRCCSLRLLFAAATAASSTADHNRSFVSSRSFVRALGLLGIETKGQREREGGQRQRPQLAF